MNLDLDYKQRNVIATECVQRHTQRATAGSVIRLYRLGDYPIIKLATLNVNEASAGGSSIPEIYKGACVILPRDVE